MGTALSGVVCGTGRNDTLSVFAMPFDDTEDGILADPKVTCDLAIATAFVNSGNDLRRKFV